MKIVVKDTREVVGEVVTNHSMDIYEACRLAGVDVEPDADGECQWDAERDLEMVY